MESLEEVIKELKKIKAKKVLIQFPEGLKIKIQGIGKKIEENGIKVIYWVENTYGACDLPIEEAKRIKVDAILHIGHTDFGIKSNLPVIYWEYFYDVDPIPILEKDFEKIKNFKKIGIVGSLQYIKAIPKVKEFLKKKGIEVYTKKTEKYEGQILGCRVNAGLMIEDKVDCFLVLSSAIFHALGLALKVRKKVFVLDFERNEIRDLEKIVKKYRKIIAWNLEKFKEARKIGILVSSKIGQFWGPEKIVEKLKKKGKEVYVFYMNEILPEKIEGLKVDFLINTACPRIGIDDIERYKIPILNIEEIIGHFD
ncbi:MAG: diphthamide biosynthesis enzyme Dph2 [Candidatus Aenigmarchaeota archaeon ex4484_224]|nr:MAG: diphthamide biosynthesis enzyme Dph2 [Candidatus Aenigmarchaeota archaeon ex4484_224]